jgi:hypothetical protein
MGFKGLEVSEWKEVAGVALASRGVVRERSGRKRMGAPSSFFL